METIPAGSITFVISENHSFDEAITENEASFLAKSLSAYFIFQLSKRNLDEYIAVTGVEYYRGCVTVIISIGAIAAASGGLGIVEFLKNYKDIREGLDRLLQDMKNMRVWVKKLFRKGGKNSPPPVQHAGNEPSEQLFEVMFGQAIDQYRKIGDEYKKFWSAGQEITIMHEEGGYCKYTMALKREDITLPKENKLVKESRKAV